MKKELSPLEKEEQKVQLFFLSLKNYENGVGKNLRKKKKSRLPLALCELEKSREE